MIELNEYDFPSRDYFRLFSREIFRRYVWIGMYVMAILYALVYFENVAVGEWSSGNFIIMTIILLFLLLLLVAYGFGIAAWHAYSKYSRPALQKRRITFDGDMFYINLADGSSSSNRLNHIAFARRSGPYYMLFLNRLAFIPIPGSAFRSEEDRLRFETEILGDKLKKRGFPLIGALAFLFAASVFFGVAHLAGQYVAEHNARAALTFIENSP